MSSVYIDPAVRRAAGHIAALTGAEAVILFGSRARGDHEPDSDWDLCVILPDDTPIGAFTADRLWREAAGSGVSIQVYPVRRSIFLESIAAVNSVSHDVAAEGHPIIGDLPIKTAA